MTDERTRLEILSEEECFALLNKEYVGRLGFISDGRVIVLPVNFVVDNGSIVFATREGTKLRAIRRDDRVAFEVDRSRPLYHSGWSVLVEGRARIVDDPEELARLERSPLRPWAGGALGHWVRIEIERVSGRRIPGA